ncbi:hypothetical protein BD311DRAFT_755538 [Dichomitus squalens]|uniref:Uncharacterized protein n=1 Tax=Dichomitus squalens TaxID=114155 RepID=A0A4Q9MUM6_9APHY|nr:hypothetical protein BD311DRAFT_755538 [Dichomitus squalens]
MARASSCGKPAEVRHSPHPRELRTNQLLPRVPRPSVSTFHGHARVVALILRWHPLARHPHLSVLRNAITPIPTYEPVFSSRPALSLSTNPRSAQTAPFPPEMMISLIGLAQPSLHLTSTMSAFCDCNSSAQSHYQLSVCNQSAPTMFISRIRADRSPAHAYRRYR